MKSSTRKTQDFPVTVYRSNGVEARLVQSREEGDVWDIAYITKRLATGSLDTIKQIFLEKTGHPLEEARQKYTHYCLVRGDNNFHYIDKVEGDLDGHLQAFLRNSSVAVKYCPECGYKGASPKT